MFHRTLFKYLKSLPCSSHTDIFFGEVPQYITKEYIRLLFACECGHDSVELLSYEFAVLLKALSQEALDERSGVPTSILKHQFKTSHLFTVLSEQKLEMLAFRQAYNYGWTITNQDPVISADVQRNDVDYIFDFVLFSSKILTPKNLKLYLKEHSYNHKHRKLYGFIKNSSLYETDTGKLSKAGKYIVNEYCRIFLIAENGGMYQADEELINSFSSLIWKAHGFSSLKQEVELERTIFDHQAHVGTFYVDENESLLDGITSKNIERLELSLADNAPVGLKYFDERRHTADWYLELAIKDQGEKIFYWD